MFDFHLCFVVVRFILDWLALGVREKRGVRPHLGLEEAHHDQYQQGAQANACPHGIVAVGCPVPYIVDHRLVLDLFLHPLSVLHETAVDHIIFASARGRW